MRQGTGTDILGPNDPRADQIGIIYVSPNDDRKSVLAAIITQEKYGRKQVAVWLPPQNKAFQRPVDFEDLKAMRNRLQTQVVFIAPSGPGPGEFARQRRFPVYPSLESYAQALREEQPIGESPKKGWFGGAKPKAADAAPPPSPSEAEQATSGGSQAAPFVAGMAAGGAAAFAADHVLHPDSGVPSAPASPGAEDDLALAPDASAASAGTGSPAGTAPAGVEATSTPGGRSTVGAGDVSGKRTKPLPEAASATPAVPVSQPAPADGRRSGSRAGMGAAAAAGAAGGRGTRRASAGGTAPPIVRGTPSGARPPGRSGRRRRSLWVLALLALLLLSLVVCTGLAFAQPSLMKAVLSNFQSQPTVTITPASHVEQNSYGIQAVTGTPNAALHQVSARQVSYTTPAQHKTATATGHTQTPAVQATGTLTFFNGNTTAYTVGAGTVFTDAKGVRITNNASVVIPAGNPITGYGKVTATAHAVNGGTAGNIRANDFNLVPCCGSAAVLVSNTAAFTGGQDPQNYSFLQQSDIDSVANSLKTALTPQGQRGLQSQRRASEQPATAPACSPTVTADQPVGDTGKDIKSATVTVSVTCTQEVYDQQGAQTLAETLLKTKATTDLPGYALVGSLLTTIKQQSVDSKTNTVSLLATTKGTWVYQFSKAQQQALAKLIAGLTAAQAKAKLLSQPGVADVSIPADVGTFPSDPTQISIVIAQVTGFPAPGSTPTSGGPGGPGATAPAGSGTPQPGRGSNDGGSA